MWSAASILVRHRGRSRASDAKRRAVPGRRWSEAVVGHGGRADSGRGAPAPRRSAGGLGLVWCLVHPDPPLR
ncbi:hypothetical protein GCM10009675_18150 [Prauserella alba]|uniref:Uncharacterized protein n=1 Tax=Prauserella alba TaxID=176898 RepID=A0ABN1VA10_9PSEU